MAIKYSRQPSTLKPPAVTGEYGRYQVKVSEANVITCGLSCTKEQIVDALQAGASVKLLSSEGEALGTMLPTITGGFLMAESPFPSPEQVGIGFSPSRPLLNAVRFEVQFEMVPTSYVQPEILSVTFWGSDGNVYENGWPVSLAGQLVINGNNLGCE